nr:immunoglobulin light chain junction region [Macaca mulatta]MOV67508.1 immunoglobulin light chain junction region [Macaca mulatta]MOV67522.1 immunoglobulin light chain junction region [Macaca mulatta]MOV68181.1 immunoglobulin light chain junction region [Macaca mulatta]MOV68424.1 immunoglobulin light chain junction region [Macaca mulatta]
DYYCQVFDDSAVLF